MVKVFIVEDEPLLRQELSVTVPWAELGCEVVGQAANGQEGEREIRRLHPQLVITDVCMPVWDGLQMIRALQDMPDMEYIIISAYSEFDYAREAIALQVHHYILKPIDDEELYEAVRGCVQSLREKADYSYMKATQSSPRPELLLPPQEQEGETSYLDRIVRYLRENFAQNITVKDAAEAFYVSESYISKLFRQKLHTSFHEFLTQLRIQKSISLLRDPSYKIYQVAEQVGYRDYRYFCSTFKKYVGITPMQFRQKRK